MGDPPEGVDRPALGAVPSRPVRHAGMDAGRRPVPAAAGGRGPARSNDPHHHGR
ncbi:hypothetical protein JOF35_008233 [Streptomyces demainii]|uniref:Uncharacterized protein n=1 Tax=Streptomyces demainii TaxID=588122 RepID=A0ABT9L5B4_9ACTN|nr:hypothetical protein [Streptomyces demainii]